MNLKLSPCAYTPDDEGDLRNLFYAKTYKYFTLKVLRNQKF